MPVTFKVANHGPEPFTKEQLLFVEVSPRAFLTKMEVAPGQPRAVQDVLQSSILDHSPSDPEGHIIPRNNGFVDTVTEAYNRHRALVVRPDDVWLAILTQFGIFVTNNADALRTMFVAHEGKRTLQIQVPGTRETADFGSLAQEFARLIDENVVDPSLRGCVLPDFTTTTKNDTTVCAVTMMATLKSYFGYEIELCCGIPQVTLEGTKGDWENILQRLEKLKEFGIQTIAWYHLLRPVVSRFVAAFDQPESRENRDFWSKVTHFQPGASGVTWRTGWITAFCVFNTGSHFWDQWQGDWFKQDIPNLITGGNLAKAVALSPAKFYETYYLPTSYVPLILDGVRYPRIESQKVTPGFTSIDVKINDNGKMFDAVMLAGSVGTRVSGEKKDKVSPVSGWWTYQP